MKVMRPRAEIERASARSARGAILGLALLAACAAPQAAAPPPATPAEPLPALAPDQVNRAVRGAVEQYRQAYEVRSLDGLWPLYSQGLDVEIIGDGRRHSGWTEVKEHMGRLLGRARSVHLRIEDLQVVALGEGGAVATGIMHREIGDGTTAVASRGVITLVLRREPREDGEGDKWLIVVEHFSRALAP